MFGLFEAVAVAAVLAGALLPLLIAICRKSTRKATIAAVVAWIAISGATAFAVYTSRPTIADPIEARPVEVRGFGYVSSQTCRACHPHEYSTWYGSYHRTMTQVATPKSVVGNFDNQIVTGAGWTYRLRTEGDEFVVDMDPKLGSPHERPVVMTTGSHHMQAAWVTNPNGNLVELIQSIYLFKDKRWVPRPAAFLIPPGQYKGRSDHWNSNCINCHSTAPRGNVVGNYAKTEVAELGIACEACHGPAEEHVRQHQKPWERYARHFSDSKDPTIVDPQDLLPRASSQVCGYCHSHGHHRVTGGVFKPGGELPVGVQPPEDTLPWGEGNPAENRLRAYFWPDGMVRGSGREYSDMLQSPCHQGGRESGQMSCLSCHSMHKLVDDSRPLREWANDQLKVGMDGDQGCLQCHPMPNIAAHTHHPVESTGSRCYNCHMPHTTYGLLKAIRAHQNTNPSVQTTLFSGRPNACNLCHLDKPLGWTADHLADWYGSERPSLSEDQESVASSILWLLTGDAAQRVLIAWHMGWTPAKESSGSDWLVLFLSQLLEDPYDVVRYVAYHSLRSLSGFDNFGYDYIGPVAHRAAAHLRAKHQWEQTQNSSNSNRSTSPAILFGPDGHLRQHEFDRLFKQRNDRRIAVIE